MMRNTLQVGRVLLVFSVPLLGACVGPARFRNPAPAEDAGTLIREPVFGAAAGHKDAGQYLHVVEWVAKRTWRVLGLPYERKDFQGPPDLKGIKACDGGREITATVASAGVPLRNQVITCEIEQRDKPVLILLRSTDAFGEVLMELDLPAGRAEARSVTVSRSMIGGQSHSSPMPEEASPQRISRFSFRPVGAGWHKLRIETRGAEISLAVDDAAVLQFVDPDPAGGKFGFGSTGTVAVRNIEQYELISPAEKARREACLREMHEFCRGLDAEYDGDVRRRNRVETRGSSTIWTWPPTGATATLYPRGGEAGGPSGRSGAGVQGRVKAGLYGDETLIEGAFPRVEVVTQDGRLLACAAEPSEMIADESGIRRRFDLPGGTASAAVDVEIRFTVQTVWWWTISVRGLTPREVRAYIGLAPQFATGVKESASSEAGMAVAVASGKEGGTYYKHNDKVGVFFKTLTPGAVLGPSAAGGHDLAFSVQAPKLRFASMWLPAQPLNPIGFTTRMVHYIKYPEGPIQHWRRRPSFQEYPDDVDLARFRYHGTEAMVWHHTWIQNDFRDREAFLVHEQEMKRAMRETHRLGMATIGYIGIVPGRSALLRFDDALDEYQKNWDLQDFTFYATPGRWQEFLPWMTDYWCREYGLDGFYADGGLGGATLGRLPGPLHPEDAALSLDEIQHRFYYRIKKVLERHKARFGLEQWGGSHDMLITGFYDCRMIGESFQEAPPEDYRRSYNALLTGTPFKMYGMRDTSQNPYNIAMAAVCMSDIQVCSGNGAWGDVADTMDTWARVRPLWDLLESIRFDRLLEARPWYAQELVRGEGFYAGNYTEPERVLIFLANRTEQAGMFEVRLDRAKLPETRKPWHVRYVLGRTGDIGLLGDGVLKVDLPPLHGGPIGIELVPEKR